MGKMKFQNVYSLYGLNGQRKYLSQQERHRFYNVAVQSVQAKKLFFLMLYYTGARISEVLNIEEQHIDTEECVVVIESLKKRKKGIFRIVPLPEEFITHIISYAGAKEGVLLWPFSRRTASRYITDAMEKSNIFGIQASAKGLRHSFAVAAIENNVPLNLIKRWMGHSSISTTAIYLDVIGKEERAFAMEMWKSNAIS